MTETPVDKNCGSNLALRLGGSFILWCHEGVLHLLTVERSRNPKNGDDHKLTVQEIYWSDFSWFVMTDEYRIDSEKCHTSTRTIRGLYLVVTFYVILIPPLFTHHAPPLPLTR